MKRTYIGATAAGTLAALATLGALAMSGPAAAQLTNPWQQCMLDGARACAANYAVGSPEHEQCLAEASCVGLPGEP